MDLQSLIDKAKAELIELQQNDGNQRKDRTPSKLFSVLTNQKFSAFCTTFSLVTFLQDV
jgi:hypothetical protein